MPRALSHWRARALGPSAFAANAGGDGRSGREPSWGGKLSTVSAGRPGGSGGRMWPRGSSPRSRPDPASPGCARSALSPPGAAAAPGLRAAEGKSQVAGVREDPDLRSRGEKRTSGRSARPRPLREKLFKGCVLGGTYPRTRSGQVQRGVFATWSNAGGLLGKSGSGVVANPVRSPSDRREALRGLGTFGTLPHPPRTRQG